MLGFSAVSSLYWSLHFLPLSNALIPTSLSPPLVPVSAPETDNHNDCSALQEMAVSAARRVGLQCCFQPLLVAAVSPPLRCPGPNIPVSPAGGCIGPYFQQGTALAVSMHLAFDFFFFLCTLESLCCTSSFECSDSNVPISPAGDCTGPYLQQGIALAVSKPLVLKEKKSLRR